MIRRFIAVATSLALAACSASVPPPSAQPPRQQPRPTPPAPPPPKASTSWMDQPQTAGDWQYSAASGQTRASFGRGDALFAVTCDLSSRVITLARAGRAAGPTGMWIRTETTERALNAIPRDTNIAATLSARDPLLDAMAFSKGRFAVETTGTVPLYLPSWVEVSRVLEDCR